tara:strand:+ start:1092 stop:1478 length:387 start_codon:yes stop_codon:yes gene_type:complete
MRIIINFFLLIILSSCSSLGKSDAEGEYRYVPITEALKKLSDEEVAARLRTASITCENDMLKVNVPSKAVDPEGWQTGQEERQRYYKNCLELKGFERKFFSTQALKRQKSKDSRDFKDEDYIEKPRFY